MRLTKVAGPASEIVVTVIAINMAAGQVSTTCPAPNRHIFMAWKEVTGTQMSIAAKMAQAR